MPRKSLRYVNSYRDRYGKLRHYLRRAGQPQIPLPGQPGSVMFMRAYKAAMAGTPKARDVARLTATGKIYYLADGDYVKIGFTTDWRKRSETYLTYSVRPLKLLALRPGTREEEKRLHRKFTASHINREWFRLSNEILDHVRETSREHEVTNLFLGSDKLRKYSSNIKAGPAVKIKMPVSMVATKSVG